MTLKKTIHRVSETLQTDRGVIIFLGVITILSFGIFIPFVGYYWDDWIWKFFSHAYSDQYLLWQPVDRPLAGTLHVLLNYIFGDSPFNWQLGNLFFRWANAAGFYWMLRKALPGQRKAAAITAIFFLIYPGFSEQWISVAFVHHLVPMTALWISFVLMFDAIETHQRSRRIFKFSCSILLALLVMLTTEYFYGIELFRGVLLYYNIRKRAVGVKAPAHLWETIKNWWPFCVLSVGMFLWRATMGVTEGATYSVDLAGIFVDKGLLDFGKIILDGMYSASVGVLLKTFSVPDMDEFGKMKSLLYIILLISGSIVSWWYFHQLSKKDPQFKPGIGIELVILGLAGLILGGLPFWLGGLQYIPNFPADRLGLSMMMGESMLLVGLMFFVARKDRIGEVVLAGLFAFALGANFIAGAAFAQSWEDQQAFWRQFALRIPALKPGTTIITTQLPPEFMSDISFMMTLNWLYESEPNESALRYGLFFGETRGALQNIDAEMPIVYDRRMIRFESELENSLLISFGNDTCLNVFRGLDGALNPNIRRTDGRFLEFSNLDQIDISVESFENWPEFFEPLSLEGWCDYYELAELAVQRGDYHEAARLGELAFSRRLTPNRSWELAPFIESFGSLQRWEEALNLTEASMRYKFNAEELLCNVWERIEANTPDSKEKQAALKQLPEVLICSRH